MKTVLITGATSGLGKEIQQYYRKKGYNTLTISRTSQVLPCDLSDVADIHTMLGKLHKSPITEFDVLVNNAGRLLLDETFLDVGRLWALLLYTPYILMERLGPKVKRHIINIASVSGMKADPDTPMYGALKAGLISLTRSYAHKLAPVRVNCISPGFFNTNLVPGEAPKELLEPVLLGREADPKEILPAVQLLDESEYITGANIVIDGGIMA